MARCTGTIRRKGSRKHQMYHLQWKAEGMQLTPEGLVPKRLILFLWELGKHEMTGPRYRYTHTHGGVESVYYSHRQHGAGFPDGTITWTEGYTTLRWSETFEGERIAAGFAITSRFMDRDFDDLLMESTL